MMQCFKLDIFLTRKFTIHRDVYEQLQAVC